MTIKLSAIAAACAAILLFLPAQALACACGCDVFDVGTSALFPSGHGQGSMFAEYDYMDQNRNWSNDHRAPAANNDDKQIRSNFLVLGGEYMFHCGFGVMLEVPVTNRLFRTDDGAGVGSFNHTALGDIRLMGVYSGFSKSMTSGIIFGVKLATGDFRYTGFDRDTSIGSGSTDLLLGGYHFGQIDKLGDWTYYGQVLMQAPMAYQDGYRPGTDLNGAFGVYYRGLTFGGNAFKLSPVAQLIASTRTRDAGPESDLPNSGYQRLMISPGLQLDTPRFRLYGDVELPVWQHVNGNQLVAPALFKLIASKSF